MNGKTKIRLDSIEQAQRTLEDLPEHSPEELTKTQAIQRLIGPIRATQSKGYSLVAISQLLSECGIPITTGALRAYVSDANGAAGKRRKRKAKRSGPSPTETASDEARSHQGVALAQTSTPVAKPRVPDTTHTGDLDWEPVAAVGKTAPPPGSAPRAGVSVRPDRKNI